MSRITLDTASLSQLSPTGFSPSLTGFPKTIRLVLINRLCSPNPKILGILVWPLSFSLAATQKIDVSFSSFRYLDVSVPGVPPIKLCIHFIVTWVSQARFPHSVISGSMDICSSPKLFAAYHDLLRLLVPRHPPYALISLNVAKSIIQFCIIFLVL